MSASTTPRTRLRAQIGEQRPLCDAYGHQLAELSFDGRGPGDYRPFGPENRRYRYYVCGALITKAGTDRVQCWRLPAQEIEDAVIRVLADTLTSPAMLLERFGSGHTERSKCRRARPARGAIGLQIVSPIHMAEGTDS
jgi:hypothetical protein